MNKLGRLSEVEMEVMQMIGGLAIPVTVAQLVTIFEDSKGWKNSTIANVPEKREWQFFEFSGFRLNLKMKTITILKYACYRACSY
ncbi:MAG: BlaI/MecI/CopY family transcriptional regulator [Defluviitaleaceae bacterium]|nr:BlaI/MecI/CopY family transcriptional regulator [Defluviitaleaceae bacterium]